MAKKKKRLVSKSEYARMAGVSAPAIDKACKGLLKAALVKGEVNIDHPAAVRYNKENRNRKPSNGDNGESGESENGYYAKDAEVERVSHLTLAELVAEHGTDEAFRKWAVAYKILADTRYKNLQTEKEEGTLIPRDMVRTHIFGALDSSNRRLLDDTPKTLTRRLKALFSSGGTLEAGEKLARELIAKQLKNLKGVAQKTLKNAE